VTAALRFLALLGVSAFVGSLALDAQDLGIRQYKPKSTLVVAAHTVARAKYPVIDIHSHHDELTPDRYAQVVREMDGLNLQILVNLSGGTGTELQRKLDVVRTSTAPTRMVQFANLDFDDIDQAGYGARQAARLEADVKAGARGVKIFYKFCLTGK